ncbi:MAG: DUF4198 domain-containing protein [Desulfovibrio sp.]|jgi:hypothetical protein|nr:DUF4198 domain-containing protein [Desulfovibrio sp.]
MPQSRKSALSALLVLCALHALACPLRLARAEGIATLLAPSRTNVEKSKATPVDPTKPSPAKGKTASRDGADTDDKKTDGNAPDPKPSVDAREQPETLAGGLDEEVDILIAMMRPFSQSCYDMDMPELFAVLRYDDAMPLVNGVLQGERRDLLGDVEEIRYQDKKAWGANVALEKPGLYQFSIDSRPWWDAPSERFLQHYVKTMLPVHGVERGWDTPLGQRLEILPLTRPFGLISPALFSGRVLQNGEALTGVSVRMTRVNTDRVSVRTGWQKELAAVSDNAGQFAFVVNQPGWWCCLAQTPGDPLKGPDGAPRPLEIGAILWFYVDAPPENPARTANRPKNQQ